LAIPAFVFLFGVVSLVWNPPLLLALFYLVISVLTYFTYAMDKSAAKKADGALLKAHYTGFPCWVVGLVLLSVSTCLGTNQTRLRFD